MPDYSDNNQPGSRWWDVYCPDRLSLSQYLHAGAWPPCVMRADCCIARLVSFPRWLHWSERRSRELARRRRLLQYFASPRPLMYKAVTTVDQVSSSILHASLPSARPAGHYKCIGTWLRARSCDCTTSFEQTQREKENEAIIS